MPINMRLQHYVILPVPIPDGAQGTQCEPGNGNPLPASPGVTHLTRLSGGEAGADYTLIVIALSLVGALLTITAILTGAVLILQKQEEDQVTTPPPHFLAMYSFRRIKECMSPKTLQVSITLANKIIKIIISQWVYLYIQFHRIR